MKVLIVEHKLQGGEILFSVNREDGSILVDNTKPLNTIYRGYSEEEAVDFHNNAVTNKTVQWYKS